MYAATVNGQRLNFVVEAVWRRNMIIRDQETGTLWQQATGEALIGPLQGTQLQALGGELMTFAGWKAQHPQTTVALEPEQWEGFLPKARVSELLERATKHFALPGQVPTDRRLPFDAFVVGVVVEGKANAYPLDHLRKVMQVEDQLGSQHVTLRYDPAADSVKVLVNNRPFAYQRTRWIGWYEFHPLTEIFQDRKTG